MDWKKEINKAIDVRPLNEDLGAAVLAGAGAVLASRAVSGMHGPLTLNRGQDRAGPLNQYHNDLAAAYPTRYGVGDLIKHLIVGKSGHDKELEVENARRRHKQALHAGNPQAIQREGGDPLDAVRNGIDVPEHHRHHLDFVRAVLDHAEETKNYSAEPAHGEDDFRDYYYDVHHAAAEHLAREGVLPRWGDKAEAGEYYLDRVHKNPAGGLTAIYIENSTGAGYDHKGRPYMHPRMIRRVDIR